MAGSLPQEHMSSCFPRAGLPSPVSVPGFWNGLYLWLLFILVCLYEDPVCHSSALRAQGLDLVTAVSPASSWPRAHAQEYSASVC